ncbi:hypothetical protein N7540_010085 [Penicillium herquei]|nr:hypothetical protein N7540_010085 [Penicillium herquei]
MIPSALQPQMLLGSPRNLYQHLHSLINNDPSIDNLTSINSCLLTQIHKEAVPPSIFKIWLFLVYPHCRHLVSDALRDTSGGVRRAGVAVALARFFRGYDWKENGWDLLGGAKGIKDILDTLPLAEVRLLLKAISRHVGSAADRQLAMECIGELIDLIEKTDAWEMRPLNDQVTFLYGYCTRERLATFLSSSSRSRNTRSVLDGASLLHNSILREIAVGTLEVPSDVRRDVLTFCWKSLLYSDEAYNLTTDDQSTSVLPPGLAFGLDLLMAMSREPKLQAENQVYCWIELIVGLGIRKRLPPQSFSHILHTALSLCRSSGFQNWLTNSLVNDIFALWSTARFGGVGTFSQVGLASKVLKGCPRHLSDYCSALDQILVQDVLQIESRKLPADPKAGSFFPTLVTLVTIVKREGRFEFLKLLCQHSPTLAFDITSFPPSEKEKELIPIWSYDLLRALPLQFSKLLFDRSLYPREGNFILDTDFLSWGNQCNLWACWEAASDKRHEDFPLVFGDILLQLFDLGSDILSGQADLLQPRTDLNICIEVVKTAESVLEDLRKVSILLLREPWAQNKMSWLTNKVPLMFSRIFSDRAKALKILSQRTSISELELGMTLLDPLISTMIEYEGMSNTKGLEHISRNWSGMRGIISQISCPFNPRQIELSFIDKLAQQRNALWEQYHEDEKGPECVWPRGLPIQRLVPENAWVYHALKRPEEAPYISSRVNNFLFCSSDTMMTIVPKSHPTEHWMVDDLWFAIQASIVKDKPVEGEQRILSIWEYYSSKLEQHKAQLESFNKWLSNHASKSGMKKAANIINPSLSLSFRIAPVPTGSLPVEWIPQDNTESNISNPLNQEEEEPPCTVLLCRMLSKVPVTTALPARDSRAKPPPSFPMWSFDKNISDSGCQDDMTHVKHSIALSALLFLASYTKSSQLLQAAFPDHENPRYPPIHLADSFITRAKAGEARLVLKAPVNALKRCGNGVPAKLLRDVIWSFLDTLKADPDSSMYSHILFRTLELIKLLLCSDQPQLTVDILLRLWMEFPDNSSLHRKISLTNVGRRLRPEQAEEMMMTFAKAVCEAIESQEKQVPGEQGKLFVKVTTAKMLAQAVGETDCISQSSRMRILQRMLDVSRHIDIRRGILDSILVLFSISNSRELYDLFSSVALSIAGPSEAKVTSEEEWIAAEEQDGPLPTIAESSQRPIIELFVSAACSRIPNELRSHYAENVLLPLLDESCRQHTRWLSIVCAKLGLSISKLGITEQEVGPFAPNLVQDIFSRWRAHLPATYLQNYHRPWAMAYLRFRSFDKIAKKLAKTKDHHLNCSEVTGYWNTFFKNLQLRPNLYSLDSRLSDALALPGAGISAKVMVEDILCRIELISKTPIRRNMSSEKWILRPNYSIEILRDLRKFRVNGSLKESFYRPTVYNQITYVMTRTIKLFNATRNQEWPSKLAKNFPMTLPSIFEYEVLMLPSPVYNPLDSKTNSCIKVFADSVISLIQKYANDPGSVLLLQFDVLESIFNEIDQESKMECALYLGRIKHEQLGPVEACVRVKLARKILDMDAVSQRSKRKSDASCEEMVEEWKTSGFDLVRQIGWAYEQSW